MSVRLATASRYSTVTVSSAMTVARGMVRSGSLASSPAIAIPWKRIGQGNEHKKEQKLCYTYILEIFKLLKAYFNFIKQNHQIIATTLITNYDFAV